MTCSICEDIVCHGDGCNEHIITADGVPYQILGYGNDMYRLLSPLGNVVVMAASQLVELMWPKHRREVA